MINMVAASDWHGSLPDFIPKGDVFVFCGDLCPNYARDWHIDSIRQGEWLRDTFIPWCHKQSQYFQYMLFIFGNHDRVGIYPGILDNIGFHVSLPSNCVFLNQKSITIGGVKFYGSPWSYVGTLKPGNWAFMESEENLKKIHSNIPKDTNILIAHSPPKYILDEKYNFGDPSLQEIIKFTIIDTVLCGHLHLDGGKSLKVDNVTYYNCSQCFQTIIRE